MLKINIQEILKQKNMNRNQFAKLMQINYPTACKLYEGETSRISLDMLENICIVLECTPNDVLISDNVHLQQRIDGISKGDTAK